MLRSRTSGVSCPRPSVVPFLRPLTSRVPPLPPFRPPSVSTPRAVTPPPFGPPGAFLRAEGTPHPASEGGGGCSPSPSPPARRFLRAEDTLKNRLGFGLHPHPRGRGGGVETRPAGSHFSQNLTHRVSLPTVSRVPVGPNGGGVRCASFVRRGPDPPGTTGGAPDHVPSSDPCRSHGRPGPSPSIGSSATHTRHRHFIPPTASPVGPPIPSPMVRPSLLSHLFPLPLPPPIQASSSFSFESHRPLQPER